MYKKFFHFVLPSMLAFAFSGLYTIVDGFFIGRNIGDIGLAAINIAFPLTALIQATGTGIGMGGAIQISICHGKNESEQEKKHLGNTLGLLVAAGIIVTFFLFLFHQQILNILGAKGLVLEASIDYVRIISIGAILQLFATGFTPLLRNYNQPFLAMIAMVSGFLTNIFLDWLFVSVLQYGMSGAALATVIGQGVTLIPCLLFLLKKGKELNRKHYEWTMTVITNIIKVGISPFGLTMSPFLVIMILNKWAVIYGGNAAVAAYAVITYVTSIIYLLLQGISDGSQPLISLCLGEGNRKDAKTIRKIAYIFSAIMAILTGGLIILLKSIIPIAFGASSHGALIVMQSLPYFVAGFLFVAFCRVTTSYFYATEKNLFAYILVYGEPVLLFILLICSLPERMGLNGVWLSALIAQILLALIGIVLIQIENYHLNKIEKLPEIEVENN